MEVGFPGPFLSFLRLSQPPATPEPSGKSPFQQAKALCQTGISTKLIPFFQERKAKQPLTV